MVEAVKRNYPQREIADAAFALQREIDARERIVVGVNAHTEGDELERAILRIDPALAALREDHNLMPNLLDCARVHATESEIVRALQDVFGTYTERPSSSPCRSSGRFPCASCSSSSSSSA